jgi:cysteinyl-tRNA synthetase
MKNLESFRKLSTTIRVKSKPLIDRPHPALTWYSCGPTVYDDAHIGHARTYVTTDVLRRVIQHYFHYPLIFAMGITDIDDKIIKRGKEMQFKQWSEFSTFTQTMEQRFLEDMDKLNVLRPDVILRVSDHISCILQFIERLIDKNHAYATSDGVYFAFRSLPIGQVYDRFGCLGDHSSEIRESIGELESIDIHDKRDRQDFALWKFSQDQFGWDSPWGFGRPGWHIECSSMTYDYFGKTLDIHSGGVDLQFPHHTNEIVQR